LLFAFRWLVAMRKTIFRDQRAVARFNHQSSVASPAKSNTAANSALP
jgi:hypothetical protein